MKLSKAEVISIGLTVMFILLAAFTLLLSPGGAAVTIDLSGPSKTAQSETSPDVSQASLINLNTATEDELTALPGIGPALARRILSYRLESGPFSEPGELMRVSGIGAATFEGLKDKITTGN